MPGESDSSALQLKDRGNNAFKQCKYQEAIDYYTKALKFCELEQKLDKAVIYKNRSACYLKLNQPENAIDDCTNSLELVPNDSKALYRRSQAHDILGDMQDAYNDAKLAYQLEPKNSAIQELMRKLAVKLQSKISKGQSTEGMIQEMIGVIEDKDSDASKREQALKNLVIYAHQPAGSEIMFSNKVLIRLKEHLLAGNAKDTEMYLKMMHGLCQGNYIRTLSMLKIVTLQDASRILSTYMSNNDVAVSLLALFTEGLTSIVDFSKATNPLPASEAHKWPKREANMNAIEAHLQTIPQYCDLLDGLLMLLIHPAVSAETRDLIVDSLVKALSLHKGVAGYILKQNGVKKLVEVSGQSACVRTKAEPDIPVTEKTADHISVAISKFADHFNYFEKEREKFGTECEAVIRALFLHDEKHFNVQGLSALSAVFQACREVGQVIAQSDDVISRSLELATEENKYIKNLATEAIAFAASSKQVCAILKNKGLETIKTLYQSKENSIQVRGLVALCKVGMTGSGNVNDRFFDDEQILKLYAAARKYLVNPKKDSGLKKWAVEGLSYLTMDGEIKEQLVNDKEALSSIIELSKADDHTVIYGICTTLVNLTNSYDKPEKNQELEKLAEFAKQPVPKEHEKDAQEFLVQRIKSLVDFGIVTALVNLSKTASNISKEMISRVFHAIVEDQGFRGITVQQGGARALIPLALDGTHKGKDYAAQALAKIGITTNPTLAFPGERCMEVVRPLISLLDVEKTGLQQFESLMALTNLAQVNDSVRKRIIKENGLTFIEAAMFEEHELLRRAATQCMCNMILCEDVFNRYLDKESTTDRLKLLVLFAGEDDIDLAKAATGGLAVLSSNKDICERISQISSFIDILKQITVLDDIDLQHRGVYVLANMMESDKAIAEKLIEGDIFEILLALSKLDGDKAKDVRVHADRALKAAQKYELIKAQ